MNQVPGRNHLQRRPDDDAGPSTPAKKQKKRHDHLNNSPQKLTLYDMVAKAAGFCKVIMVSEPLIISDKNRKMLSWFVRILACIFVKDDPTSPLPNTTEPSEPEGTEKSILINLKIPEAAFTRSNVGTIKRGDFIKLNSTWAVSSGATQNSSPCKVTLTFQADESNFKVERIHAPSDIPENLGQGTLASIMETEYPLYDTEAKKGSMSEPICGFVVQVIPSKKNEDEEKKDSPTSIHMTVLSTTGPERLQLSFWGTCPTNPLLKLNLNSKVGNIALLTGVETSQHSETYGTTVTAKLPTAMWFLHTDMISEDIKLNITDWTSETIFAKETICKHFTDILSEFEDMAMGTSYSRYLIVENVFITNITECLSEDYCGSPTQPNCLALMKNQTTCERNHVQAQSAPIERTKVVVQVSPQAQPADSFNVEAVLASITLLGDDPNTIDWAEWQDAQQNRPLTLKLRMQKEPGRGGFSLTVFNVIKPITTYQ